MRPQAITALGSGASLLAGIAVPIAFPEIEPWVGYSLLVVAALFAALAFGLSWPRRTEAGQAQRIFQETQGHGAHAISAGRDVHVHAAPATEQPRQSPYGSGLSPQAKRLSEQMDRLPSAIRRGLGIHEPLPDMELREVVQELHRRLPPASDENEGELQAFEDRIDVKIMDAVHNRKLHTWGRRKRKGPLDRVWDNAWLRGDFSHMRGSITYRAPDNPRAKYEWTDLHFNREEVEEWLRPRYEMFVV